MFFLSDSVLTRADARIDRPALLALWKSHSAGLSSLAPVPGDALSLRIGSTPVLAREGAAYAIHVTEDGVSLVGADERALLDGYFDLVSRICLPEPGKAALPCGAFYGRARVERRMVHFCVFPETELWQLERIIRFAASQRITHLILEFWGMLRYDVLPELAWPHAFTKEQIRPLLHLAEELGLSVIPQFNHWGHATGARVLHGKHVVLDQNPSLAYLFSPDGWCWNIERPETLALLRRVREEWLELLPRAEAFHIGCDEAYSFTRTPREVDAVAAFINQTRRDLAQSGRETILWADMLLSPHAAYRRDNAYFTLAPDEAAEADILSRLDRELILADWQYEARRAPIETAQTLQQAGFRVIACSWDRSEANVAAILRTGADCGLYGVCHTTWHTLTGGMPLLWRMAAGCWSEQDALCSPTEGLVRAAAALRRACPVSGYEKAGWAPKEIGVIV